MILLLVFAFVSGLITIAAPCIWPLLPIVLSASATGGKRKPLGVTSGVMVSFSFATLALSYLVKIVPIDVNVLRYVAVGIIVVLGAALIIPSFSSWLEGLASRLVGKLGMSGQQRGKGFGAGFVTGLALGVVWAPCAGPILATIVTLSATQAVSASVVALTIAYVLGTGVPLFLFALLGNTVMRKSRWLNNYLVRIQQVFGVVMIITAIGIAFNIDKTVQVYLLNAFPGYGKFVTDFESSSAITKQLDQLGNRSSEQPAAGVPAPELVGITNWLNSEPLTLSDLRGKVVLIDFWTYTCINCIRTFPHLQKWYETYKNDDFVIIGVHAPEFEFEKSTANVEAALKQYGLTYPVAQDNDFRTWQNYDNRYWPAEYLIDADGNVRKIHFGEGGYDEMEEAIRELLVENGQTLQDELAAMPDETPQSNNTPESYLGASRMDRFASNEAITVGENEYTYPAKLALNQLAYSGTWNVYNEYAEAEADAKLKLHFKANDVFIVLTPTTANDEVTVMLDGQPVPAEFIGDDVVDGKLMVTTDRLYHLIHSDSNLEGELELQFNTPGTQAFAFTFGG